MISSIETHMRNFANKSTRDKVRAVAATFSSMGQTISHLPTSRRKMLTKRVIEGALTGERVFKGNAEVYASYRPDSDVVHGAHPELAELAAKWVAHNASNNAGDLPRLYALVLNLKQVLSEGVEGDFAEVGVFRGNSATIVAHFARLHGRSTYLFDTFEGFDARDLDDQNQMKIGEFSDTSLDFVRSFVGADAVNFIKGYFPQSVTPEISVKRFALVHLDCDLYGPIKAAMEFFYPRLSPGGAMIVHDYSSLWWEGVKRAADEFVRTVPEQLVLLPDKSGTAILRKSVPR